MSEKIIIIGAGGHARVIADIIRCCGNEVAGFLDDRPADNFQNMNILGTVADAEGLKKVKFIIGIGNNDTRQKIAERFPKLTYTTAIHPSAVIAHDVVIGAGTVVMANAVINTGSKIGAHCIINTASTVDHDNVIGDFVHISPGAHLSGTVSVGDKTWICTGANVSNNINIYRECTIGAGAVVVKNIVETGVYLGLVRKMQILVYNIQMNLF